MSSTLTALLLLCLCVQAMGFLLHPSSGVFANHALLPGQPDACAHINAKRSISLSALVGSGSTSDEQDVATGSVGQEERKKSRGAKDFLSGTSWLLKLGEVKYPFHLLSLSLEPTDAYKGNN
jgi:hypothetical protein